MEKIHSLWVRKLRAVPAVGGLWLACSVLPASAGTDYNSDGLCDVWQQLYGAFGLTPGDDEDLDGCSNLVESIAGTDPFDPLDCHTVGGMAVTAGNVVFTFEAEKGKKYTILSASSPTAPPIDWTDTGVTKTAAADGTDTLSIAKPVGSILFYKLRVEDVDGDSDGVSDWAEEETGTNPALASSPGNASGGAANDGDTLESLMSLTIAVVDASAAEKEGTKARVRLSRTVGTMPLTLPFTTKGSSDPTKGSCDPADYALEDGSGSSLTSSITLAGGDSSEDIVVDPVDDGSAEVPEALGFDVELPGASGGGPLLEASVHVCDAEPTAANRTLYVAFLGRESGVSTTATGIATALVEGDNDVAMIAVNFSNLTSVQNTAYIRIGADLDIFRIPNGQVSDFGWPIRAEATVLTDQAMLDALRNGNLYVDITTGNNPTGEIRGIFQLATGSETPPTPENPPAIGSAQFPDLAGDDLERDIYRFMQQASFGPTTDLYNEIHGLITTAKAGGGTYIDGLEDWIDKQMDPVQTPIVSWRKLTQAADLEEHLIRNCAAINDNNDPQFEGNAFLVSNGNVNNVDNNNRPNHQNRRREWFTMVTQCPDQLRQRMAMALTEICVISENDGTVRDRHYGATHYWDQMANNAFGQYRDILEDVTYSPMMGVYLSHLKNRKATATTFPDENYAREIMQLFTIGLILRHDDGSLVLGGNGLPIPTYDQVDITELAKVMTGLSFGKRNKNISAPRYPNPQNQHIGVVENNSNFTEPNNHRYWQAQWTNPMKIFTTYHEYGAKTLFAGKVGEKSIPSRSATVANGDADLKDAHDALAGDPTASDYDASNGHPNTPVFICRLLIQRFVSANPSAGYLYRVTQAYKDSNGDLGDVIKAILLDYEARSLDLADLPGSGKPKETLVHYVAVLRALATKSGVPLATLRSTGSAVTVDTVSYNNLQSYFPPSWTADTPSKYVWDVDPFPDSEYNKFPPNSYRLRHNDTNTQLGMAPLRAPSVFNWFLPDYVVPGALSQAGLVSPELQIMTDSQVVYNVNQLWSLTWSSTALDDNPPSIIGFGGDNFFNLHNYKKNDPSQPNDPNAPGATQLPMPQIVQDRGYRSDTGSGGGTDHQLDRIRPDFNELYDLYENTYDTAILTQSVGNSHNAAIDALVDKVDLLICAGYLKATWDGDSSPNPRKSIIDFCRSLRKQDKQSSANNFRNDVINRVRYVCYLVSTSPQGLVLR